MPPARSAAQPIHPTRTGAIRPRQPVMSNVSKPMFRCPACHRPTISLFQRVAASAPSYPAVCSKCNCQCVADQSLLGSFAWIEVPALLLIGVLWLITNDWFLASQIAVASVVVLLPASLLFVPLRTVPRQDPYPESLGSVTVVRSVFGPAAYVLFLVFVFGVLIWAAYVLLLAGR